MPWPWRVGNDTRTEQLALVGANPAYTDLGGNGEDIKIDGERCVQSLTTSVWGFIDIDWTFLIRANNFQKKEKGRNNVDFSFNRKPLNINFKQQTTWLLN